MTDWKSIVLSYHDHSLCKDSDLVRVYKSPNGAHPMILYSTLRTCYLTEGLERTPSGGSLRTYDKYTKLKHAESSPNCAHCGSRSRASMMTESPTICESQPEYVLGGRGGDCGMGWKIVNAARDAKIRKKPQLGAGIFYVVA